MLLALDVGNTTINAGIFKGKKLAWQRKVSTGHPAALKGPLKRKSVKHVIISSVVPETTVFLKNLFREDFGIDPIILGKTITVPIRNLYKDPGQVGQDRLVNAFAGYNKFGGGLIIVDFGTAITFDVVSKKGEYAGGLIVPGINTSLNALYEKTALLPKVRIKDTGVIVGLDTATSMRSGILNGFGSLCDGIVRKIRHGAGSDYKVILTGGDAMLMSKYCEHHTVVPDLTLEGLFLIHKDIDKKNIS